MENIKMLHRVFFYDDKIQKIYKKRGLGLSCQYQELITYIDKQLNNNHRLGSLNEAIADPSIIHLSFDDGYVEHLEVAKKLKERYDLQKQDITFCINIRNCVLELKVCTDIFYFLIEEGKIDTVIENLYRFGYKGDLNSKEFLSYFDEVKAFIFEKELPEIIDHFKILTSMHQTNKINSLFMKTEQIIQLSKYFSIASHAVNHIYLDKLDEKKMLDELNKSKNTLENLINTQVRVFCYPDGRNTKPLQKLCKRAGYQYALAINTIDKLAINPYCIPRCSNLLK